jgi:3-oxoacyl-[acyl-carrier-protein] synthase III
MAARTVIESLGRYLPPESVTTAQVLAGCRHTVPIPLQKITGIQSRRVAESEYSVDLARKATADCFSRSKIPVSSIDLVISCDISRSIGPSSTLKAEPGTSAILKQEFSLSSATCFDVSNACAGVFTAIYLAESFFKAGAATTALVISGEHITHLMKTAQKLVRGFRDDRLACLTLGDAGVAFTLKWEPDIDYGFAFNQLYTLGGYSDLCVGSLVQSPCAGAVMRTNSKEIGRVGIREYARQVAELHHNEEVDLKKVDHFLIHQTAKRTLNGAAKALNSTIGQTILTTENTVNNLGSRGNTATTSHCVALYDLVANDRLTTGDNILFGIAASGQTAGQALYKTGPNLFGFNQSHAAENCHPASSSGDFLFDGNRLEICEAIWALPDSTNCQSAVDLATIAAKKCLKSAGVAANEMDFILHTGVLRDDFQVEPALAAMIAGRLESNHLNAEGRKTSFAFDIANSANGILTSCLVGSQLLHDGTGHVLITASEPKLPRAKGSSSMPILSCGAALYARPSTTNSGFARIRFFHAKETLDLLEIKSSHCSTGIGIHVAKTTDFLDRCSDFAIASSLDFLADVGLSTTDLALLIPPGSFTQLDDAFRSKFAGKCSVTPPCPHDGLYNSGICWGIYQMKRFRDPTLKGKPILIVSVGAGLTVCCALYYA